MIFKGKKKQTLPEPPYNFPEVEEIQTSVGKLPELPELPELPKLPELPEQIPEFPEMPKVKKMLTRDIKVARVGEAKEKKTGIARPLFIKIDHFKEILASVDAIEKNVQEISDVIRKLREIRQREEQEMARWGQEIQELKAKLELIEKVLSRIE